MYLYKMCSWYNEARTIVSKKCNRDASNLSKVLERRYDLRNDDIVPNCLLEVQYSAKGECAVFLFV